MLRIYSLSNFRIYHTVLLSIPMSYIISQVLIYLITGSLYHLTTFFSFSLPSPPPLITTDLISFSVSLVLFLCFLDIISLSIHPLMDTFHVLAIVYNAAMNMGIQTSQHGVSVSIVAAPTYILTSSAQGFPFLHILLNFCYLLPF